MAARPRTQASDSVTLLLSLVPYLIEASPVSIHEAAKNFGVADKTIREAVEGLTTLGVADKSGIPMDGQMFDIDWDEFLDRDTIHLTHTVGIDRTPRLSAREAATLVAGLALIEQAVNESNRSLVAGLRRKVAQGSSSRVADIGIAAAQAPTNLTTIRSAIEDGVHVAFDYRGAGGVSQKRLIDPIRIECVSGTWYVRGYCHLRDALRTFRADRMADVTLESTPTDTSLTANDLDEALFAEHETDIVASLHMPTWALAVVSDFGPRHLAETGDHVTVEIRFATLENVYRALSRRPGVITVVGPESLRQQVAQWASDAL